MSKHIIDVLQKKLNENVSARDVDVETLRNILKEELQYYVLNFIYNHREYKQWVMYGGSALRIIHKLDRMSVDLDFEVSNKITKEFLSELKKEIEDYFLQTYSTDLNFMDIKIVTGRGLLLRFNIGESLNINYHSKQVHVKIDLNHFVTQKSVTERRPINRDQVSFVITTYNMSTLMASKIAAIFLRGRRGVGKVFYEEKGRDIYDLLWYMNKGTVPDLDYLITKNVKEAENLRTLFEKLTIKMNTVNDTNLKQDLLPLFINRAYIENWLKNWRESYLQLANEYEVCTVTTLENMEVYQNFRNDNFLFTFIYRTGEGKNCWISYEMVYYWVGDCETSFPPSMIDEKINNIMQFKSDGKNIRASYHDKLKKYATIFHQKNEKYLNKTNRMILCRNQSITTKLIRSTAEQFNPKDQIILNKSTLLTCELDDLLK